MKGKRYSVEQIIARLREAEKRQAPGITVAQTCKRLQISNPNLFLLAIQVRRIQKDEAQRLKALEQENSRLKKIFGVAALVMCLIPFRSVAAVDHVILIGV